MIDAYYFGDVDRISPEAPVPIVSVQNRENRLGGAANVALNIQALGANPILCATIGNDDEGKLFNKLLLDQKLSNEGILSSDDRITTVKTRIIGNNHQVLRIDSETDKILNSNDNNTFVKLIESLISAKKVDAVIFEDYDKGTITNDVITTIVSLCNQKNIPTSVDPKKRNFLSYKNVSLFKPNLKELKEGLNIDINPKNINEVSKAVDVLNKSLNNTLNFITLSENGVFIKNNSTKHHLAAHYRNIADVSGAGDTVISVASLCLALNQSPLMIAEISNLAGGLVCEKVGVVPIDKDQLLSEAISKLV